MNHTRIAQLRADIARKKLAHAVKNPQCVLMEFVLTPEELTVLLNAYTREKYEGKVPHDC